MRKSRKVALGERYPRSAFLLFLSCYMPCLRFSRFQAGHVCLFACDVFYLVDDFLILALGLEVN